MSIFEIIMLVCFGAAWPFSIYRSYVSRSNQGKSIIFLAVVLIGYISGVLHKLLHSPDYVIVLYVLNGAMVVIDMIIYLRNARIAKPQAQPI